MRYYLSYRPSIQNTFSVCFLNQFLYIKKDIYSSVRYIDVVSDGERHYGFIESDDPDVLAKLWKTISGEFSADRLKEEEFIGACYLYYVPITERPDENEINFFDFMKKFGFYITEEQANECLRTYKRYLFKELIRKRFEDYNDLVADMFKFIYFIFRYYPTLNDSEKEWFNSIMDKLSNVYVKELCIEAINNMDLFIDRFLIPYYYKVEELKNKNTREDIASVKISV